MKKIYYALMVEENVYKGFNKLKKDQGLTASSLLSKLLGRGRSSKAKKVEGGGK